MSPLIQTDRPTSRVGLDRDLDLFEQTVPRSLVHRAAVSEVLVTGWRSTEGTSYRLGAQWSRGHSYYGSVANRWHDPMLLAESIRQSCLLLAHEALDVPMTHQFLTTRTSFQADEAGVRLSRPGRPAHVVLDMSLAEVKRRAGAVSSYAYDVVALRDGERIGSGYLQGQCVSPAVYKRLRGDRYKARASGPAVQPVDPRLVGRDCEFDVVLGTSVADGVMPLRIDPEHPVLFDHPVDHVSGMVLMEAARQMAVLALRAPSALLVACEANFKRYVEFHVPCLVTVGPSERDAEGRSLLTVRFHQGGAEVGTCRVAMDTSAED
ncbi:ScbA/BarX family gamma-butyrolactone biosynthesis protein [Streptomyces sp. NPDC102406]|uniref:ScbA/BarX family gamma-butyrolactone biosynthesis protein n=1 Tax=Streptomyces sp. NPDC102406 TaxID=3366171 RepID=UPI00382731C6